jgi:hypothetical protein
MAVATRTSYLHINSVKRQNTETTGSLTVALPADVLTCDANEFNEYLRLTCVSFQMPMSWTWVNETNDHFRVSADLGSTWTTIFIPHYQYPSFRAMVKTASASLAAAVPGCSMWVHGASQRVMFTFPTWGIGWVDPMSAYAILGMSKGLVYYQFNPSGLFADGQPSIGPITQLYLCVENVSVKFTPNLSTTAGTAMDPMSTLMGVPLQLTAPGDVISVGAADTGQFLEIANNDLTMLTLTLRDEDGNLFTLADDVPDAEYNCVIKVEVMKIDDVMHKVYVGVLKMIEYLRLIFIQRSIR